MPVGMGHWKEAGRGDGQGKHSEMCHAASRGDKLRQQRSSAAEERRRICLCPGPRCRDEDGPTKGPWWTPRTSLRRAHRGEGKCRTESAPEGSKETKERRQGLPPGAANFMPGGTVPWQLCNWQAHLLVTERRKGERDPEMKGFRMSEHRTLCLSQLLLSTKTELPAFW